MPSEPITVPQVEAARLPEWWTLAELGERWRKKPEAVRRLIGAGKLKAMQCGGAWRIHTSTIEAFERGAKMPAAKPPRRKPVFVSSSSEPDPIGEL